MKYCSSGKIGFRSQDDATISTIGIRNDRGKNMKSYLCPECGEWHRASRNKKSTLAGAQRKKYRKTFQKLRIRWKRFWK